MRIEALALILGTVGWASSAEAEEPCGHRGPISHAKAVGPSTVEMCLEGATRTCWRVDLKQGKYVPVEVATKDAVMPAPRRDDTVHADDPVALHFEACHPITKVCKKVLRPSNYATHAVTADGKYIVVGKNADGENAVSGMMETLRFSDLSSVVKAKDKFTGVEVEAFGPVVLAKYTECWGMDCEGIALFHPETLKKIAKVGSDQNDAPEFLQVHGDIWLLHYPGDSEGGHASRAVFHDFKKNRRLAQSKWGRYARKMTLRHRRRPKEKMDAGEQAYVYDGVAEPYSELVATSSGLVAAIIDHAFNDGLAGDIAQFAVKGSPRYFRLPECADKKDPPSESAEKKPATKRTRAELVAESQAMSEMGGVWRGEGHTVGLLQSATQGYLVFQNRDGAEKRIRRDRVISDAQILAIKEARVHPKTAKIFLRLEFEYEGKTNEEWRAYDLD